MALSENPRAEAVVVASFSDTKATDLDAVAQDELAALRKVEADLRLSEERYRTLTLSTTALVFTTGANGMFITPQASWEAFTGQTWEEQQNWGGMQMVHPDDRDRVVTVWKQAIADLTPYDAEDRIWHIARQEYRWCRLRAIPLLASDGTAREWVGVATDIHEQKTREQHQAFLTHLNTHILPQSDPDAILWTAVNLIGPYLNCNRCHFGDLDFENDQFTLHRSYLYNATSTAGTTPVSAYGPPAFVQALQQGRTVIINDTATDTLVSAYYGAAYHPMNVGAYVAVPCMSVGRCVAALIVDSQTPRLWTPQEVELLETVAHRIWLSVENSRLYQQAQAELKQRQKAQAALQTERERLSAIIAEMPAGVMLLSAEAKLLLVNREAERIYDLPDLMAVPEDEFSEWKVFRPDGSLLLRHEYPTMRSLTNGETVRNEEYLLERRDGTRIPLLVNSAPLHDTNGKREACILTFSDITPLKEIETALRTSEALYRTIGESGPDYVWSTDANGTPNYVSRAWAEYTRGPAEKIGKVGKSFLHPSHYTNFVRIWDEAKANGSSFETEFLYRRYDGVYRWFMSRAVPVKDEHGNIQCWVGTTTDIHKRKMAEEALHQSEERLRSLVDVLTAVIWTTDGTGAFVTPQIAWERYTGQPWEEHRGAGWAQMLHPDDRERIVAAWEQTVVNRTSYRVEGRLWHAGSQRYRHFVAKAVALFHPDDAIREWVGTVEDVEDAKQREEEILALNAHLRLGIQETHHRVKNNLQVIAAMLDMNITDAEHALPLSDARRIVSQVQMLAKIHDILTIEARFDRFGEDISSQVVLERLLPLLQAAAGIQLKSEIEEMVLTVGQATSLALVLNELVSNAVKYGRGHVEVIFTVSESQGVLQVKDNGDGFPENFDFRTDANTGLMIVEQVVRHDLRGTVRFTTRSDQPGAEVVITLPRSEYLQKSS